MIEAFSGKEKIPEPTETPFELDGKRFSFETYNVGKTEDLPNPGLMPTGQWQHVMEIWRKRRTPAWINDAWEQYEHIPYTFLLSGGAERRHGDFTTNLGMNEFKDADLRLTDQGFSPQDWVADIWRFARLKNPRTFGKDETLATLRGLEQKKDGKLLFTVGPGRYSDGFYSMGSEGITTGLSPQERETFAGNAELMQLNEKLVREYGEGKSLREIIAQKSGHLPEFGEGVYNHLLGVAGTVLTKDGKFIFIRRGKNVSVNQGINVTASGAVHFDKDSLSKLGIHGSLADAMAKESNEEIGLKSGELILGAMQEHVRLEVGLTDVEYELIPVGMARELPRGGSPETMFLIRYRGNTEDLIKSIMHNDHPDRAEIDELVYAMPARSVRDLVETPGAASVLQHKAILNMVFAIEFLKNHPWN